MRRHWRPLLPSVMLLLSVSTLASAGPVPLPSVRNRVAVIAHRGGALLAPENTLAAIRASIALGADYVEIDVRTTRDGELVLMHDASVDRTTDGTGLVRELDLAAIRELDAGAKSTDRTKNRDGRFTGEMIPTLDEALELCQDRINVYLDLKDADAAAVLRLVDKYRLRRQIVVYGPLSQLQEWKRLAPDVPVMPTPGAEYRHAGGIAAFLEKHPADVFDGSVLDWTRALVAEAHTLGRPVYVDTLWLMDRNIGWLRALTMGVDGIQTDQPDSLLEFLRRYRYLPRLRRPSLGGDITSASGSPGWRSPMRGPGAWDMGGAADP